MHESHTKVSFTEDMKGFVTFGEMDFERGARLGKESGTSIMFHLTITVDGVNRFVTHPDHDTDDVKGYVECEALGGQREVERAGSTSSLKTPTRHASACSTASSSATARATRSP